MEKESSGWTHEKLGKTPWLGTSDRDIVQLVSFFIKGGRDY